MQRSGCSENSRVQKDVPVYSSANHFREIYGKGMGRETLEEKTGTLERQERFSKIL